MKLDGKWLLSCSIIDKDIPMNIPGNFEDALFSAGIVKDPYISNNSSELRKFEFAEFTLKKQFSVDSFDGGKYQLTFDGIDGTAEVFVNGRFLGTCENSFIPHTFILEDELSQNNEITLVFKSSIEELKKYPMRTDMFSSYQYNAEAAVLRRPAHIWGWDIFPRMALGGIFYGVTLEKVQTEKICEFDFITRSISGNSADMRLVYKVDLNSIADGNSEIRVEGICEDSRFYAAQKLRSYCGFIHFTVENAKLWWPRRYGSSPLYDVKISLVNNGTIIDEKTFAFGIRTCGLIAKSLATESMEPDFQFVINNRKIRVFGTNHVPLDALHSHDKERLEMFFDLVNECSVDMLRIWGGGVYETDEFYDLCDKYGILVWQDFMMGCAVYPQDEKFCRNLELEAQTVVKRLRRHPSIVLWAGDNECDAAPSWGKLDIDPQSNELTRKVLAKVCRHNDISRPYLPSSPWCSPEAQKAADLGVDPTLFSPEQHLWGPRDYFKSDFYRNTKASFLSEFGYHGCPSAESVKKFIPEEYLFPLHNDICRHHASNPFLPDDTQLNYRIKLMYDQIKEFFGSSVPDNLEDFALASQIIQAEALKFIIELFRMKKKCSGLLWWNLIDGWPQFSDAVVDYYGRKKLAFHVLKNLHKKVLVTLSETNAWHRKIIAANDSFEKVKGSYSITAHSTGKVVRQGDFILEPDSVTVLDTVAVCTTEKELYLINYSTDIEGDIQHHYLAGYPQFDYNFFKDNYLNEIYREI